MGPVLRCSCREQSPDGAWEHPDRQAQPGSGFGIGVCGSALGRGPCPIPDNCQWRAEVLIKPVRGTATSVSLGQAGKWQEPVNRAALPRPAANPAAGHVCPARAGPARLPTALPCPSAVGTYCWACFTPSRTGAELFRVQATPTVLLGVFMRYL